MSSAAEVEPGWKLEPKSLLDLLCRQAGPEHFVHVCVSKDAELFEIIYKGSWKNAILVLFLACHLVTRRVCVCMLKTEIQSKYSMMYRLCFCTCTYKPSQLRGVMTQINKTIQGLASDRNIAKPQNNAWDSTFVKFKTREKWANSNLSIKDVPRSPYYIFTKGRFTKGSIVLIILIIGHIKISKTNC